jgi:hypothetical protein
MRLVALREEGRLPMLRFVISASGVDAPKYSMKPGVFLTSAR